MRRLWMVAAVALPSVLSSSTAIAANTNKTRVAPAFWGEACIVTVDRSVDPVATLGLAIPFEDDSLTEDELLDSRRFQYFALCEDHPVQRELPNWVTMDDAERSLDLGLIETLPGQDEILATAPSWQSVGHDGQAGTCVVAINGADARVPITCQDTAAGIEWDTSGVAAGTYVVRSYTFEPQTNLWARRPGLVRVVDGDDDPGPSVTLTTPRRKATTYEKPGFMVSGCLAGAPGTVVTLQYAEAAAVAAEDESAWTTSHELTPDASTFEALFVPPAQTVYKALYLRAIATDPQGRTWVAHADHEIVVLPDCGQADGGQVGSIADGCGVVPDGYKPPGVIVEQPSDCDFTPETDGGLDDGDSEGDADGGAATGTTGASDDDGSGGTSAGAADGDSGGCRVGTGGQTPRWTLLLVAFGALGRRRTRSQ